VKPWIHKAFHLYGRDLWLIKILPYLGQKMFYQDFKKRLARFFQTPAGRKQRAAGRASLVIGGEGNEVLCETGGVFLGRIMFIARR
jgi:hypothetical protein